jgi:hypothetical protein
MSAVVRTAGAVRRTAGPWTPTIHRLLEHLRARGLDWVPRPLGMTDDGLEVLTPVEVVCHNDFAPYNLVFDESRAIVGDVPTSVMRCCRRPPASVIRCPARTRVPSTMVLSRSDPFSVRGEQWTLTLLEVTTPREERLVELDERCVPRR